MQRCVITWVLNSFYTANLRLIKRQKVIYCQNEKQQIASEIGKLAEKRFYGNGNNSGTQYLTISAKIK